MQPKKHHYTETYHQDGYAYFGSTCKTHIVIVRPHRKGLKVYTSRQLFEIGSRGRKTKGRKSTTYIIPGQYSLDALCQWLHAITGDDPTPRDKHVTFKNGHSRSTSAARRMRRMKTLLLESGIWESRGRLNWTNLPPRFFSVVPIRSFIHGSTQSYATWWKRYLVATLDYDYSDAMEQAEAQLGIKHTAGTAERLAVRRRAYYLRLREMKAQIADGTYPAFPHLITGWGKVPLKYLAMHYRKHVASPLWGTFVGEVLPRFGFCALVSHASQVLYGEVSEFNGLARYLARLDERVPKDMALDLLSSAPINFLVEMNLTDAHAVPVLLDSVKAYRHANNLHRSRTITPEYQPPALTLPQGWHFADAQTLESVLNRHRVWSSFEIGQHMADGVSHVIYRDDSARGNALGVLRYHQPIVDGEEPAWKVERLSPSHGQINPFFEMAITGIVNKMNREHPGPGPALPQIHRDAVLWQAMRQSPLAQHVCKRFYEMCHVRGTDLEPVRLDRTHPAYANPGAIIEQARAEAHPGGLPDDLMAIPF